MCGQGGVDSGTQGYGQGVWMDGGVGGQGGVCEQRVYTPPPTHTHTQPLSHDGHCRGRYASYWSAFLFTVVLQNESQ